MIITERDKEVEVEHEGKRVTFPIDAHPTSVVLTLSAMLGVQTWLCERGGSTLDTLPGTDHQR